ncbi:MAG: hypothetical protein LBE13_06260, partial [Bacteroidales bacterium]|nr:hypothetical protein [Bacteroidales bacterium]
MVRNEDKSNYNMTVNLILQQINKCLFDYISKKNEIKRLKSLGIYNGEFGLLLYMALYNKYFPEPKFKNDMDLFVEYLLEEWSENPDCYTYCSGTSGILDMLSYLNENDIYHIDLCDVQDYLENYIANRMIKDINEGQYDFLHGALGPANYLLNKNTKLDYVEKFIHLLKKCSIKDGKIYKWLFFDPVSNKKVYNIALSHGMSSIVIFLSDAYRHDICRNEVSELLLGCSRFILNQKFDIISENRSMFPPMSKEDDITSSRLGWCYGDLGIAVALWEMGESMNLKEYKNWAICIVENTMGRTDLNANMIRDAGICHGTAGVAMMFQYCREKMNLDKALILRDYWLSETIKMIPLNNQRLIISDW